MEVVNDRHASPLSDEERKVALRGDELARIIENPSEFGLVSRRRGKNSEKIRSIVVSISEDHAWPRTKKRSGPHRWNFIDSLQRTYLVNSYPNVSIHAERGERILCLEGQGNTNFVLPMKPDGEDKFKALTVIDLPKPNEHVGLLAQSRRNTSKEKVIVRFVILPSQKVKSA